MSVVFTPCVVIPCYNHGAMIDKVLTHLQPYNLPCIIIDDGSDEATRHALQALKQKYPDLRIFRQAQNSGKGGAVMRGLQEAANLGFTHAVQVDADGQHAINDLPKMLKLAQQYPQALISGQPIYDDSIPRSRRIGRWITHFWVWLETLSFQIKDTMCGFRVYPLVGTLTLLRSKALGERMDFDIEVMVRLYWQGVDVHFVPTKVTYPEDGLSHFDALKDNVLISLMHTRLVFGMLVRIPYLLQRNMSGHWAQQQEVKGLLGMRIMLKVWNLFGRGVFSLLLWPVVACYWLVASTPRRASQQWLELVKKQLQKTAQPIPVRFNSYWHFHRFANAMLDKIASWNGELKLHENVLLAPGAEEGFNVAEQKGKLVLGSHLGDLEVCRALGKIQGIKTINAIVFHENAQRFKTIMEEMAPDASLNLIPVTNMGPDTAILLKEKIDAGEWVAIVGDRIAVDAQRGSEWRVVWSEFMGQPAPFPQGPFILASILRCPVVLLFALQQKNNLYIHCERFTDQLILPRTNRQQALQEAVDRYAKRLEHYALMAPLDWFNFYDFWQLPKMPVEK